MLGNIPAFEHAIARDTSETLFIGAHKIGYFEDNNCVITFIYSHYVRI